MSSLKIDREAWVTKKSAETCNASQVADRASLETAFLHHFMRGNERELLRMNHVHPTALGVYINMYDYCAWALRHPARLPQLWAILDEAYADVI